MTDYGAMRIQEYDEFVAAVRKGGQIGKATLSDKELRLVFVTADTDGGGDLSIEELTTFVWPGRMATTVIDGVTIEHNASTIPTAEAEARASRSYPSLVMPDQAARNALFDGEHTRMQCTLMQRVFFVFDRLEHFVSFDVFQKTIEV